VSSFEPTGECDESTQADDALADPHELPDGLNAIFTRRSRSAAAEQTYSPFAGVAADLGRAAFGPQLNAIGDINRSLFSASDITRSLLADTAAELIRSPFADTAAELGRAALGPQLNAIGNMNALFSQQLSPMASLAQNLLASQFQILQGAELDRISGDIARFARHDSQVVPMNRDLFRKVWGAYIYMMVWSIYLMVLLRLLEANETTGIIAAIATTMTPANGPWVASRAKEIALQRFDRYYPPESKAPEITKLLF
jgi:hypothetical protein